MNTEQKPNFYQRHKKVLKIIGISVLCMLSVGAAIYLNKNAGSENEEESISFTDNKDESNEEESISFTDNKDESNIIEFDHSISSDDSPVQESVSKTVGVSGHIRKLSEGQHPSPKKLAEAEDRGIPLSDNETLVDSHERKIA